MNCAFTPLLFLPTLGKATAAADQVEKKMAFLSQSLKLLTLIHCPGRYHPPRWSEQLTLSFLPTLLQRNTSKVVKNWLSNSPFILLINTSLRKLFFLFYLFRKIAGIMICYINVIVSTYSLSNQQKQSLNQCHFLALK